MANLNKVMFIGRLTRDPALKYTPSGAAVADFGLAVNRYYNTQDGERKEDTCFLDVSAWGKLGETVNNYLRKGRQVFIEGYLKFDQWENKDGQRRSKISVVANTVQFLDSGQDAGMRRAAPADLGAQAPADLGAKTPADLGAQAPADLGAGSGRNTVEPGVSESGSDSAGQQLDEECPF